MKNFGARYALLSDVLLLFWRVAKIRGAVKQIFLGSGETLCLPGNLEAGFRPAHLRHEFV